MSNQKPWLDIFVLCHNRPDSARETIASILDQSEGGFRLIVSDNSTNDSVARMMAEHFPNVERRDRRGIPPFDHFNQCIAEAEADYFCLFHDDDLMGKTFVATYNLFRQQFPEAIALGCNAWVVNLPAGHREPGIHSRYEWQRIDCARTLFQRYFGQHQTGIAPFPGYIYQTRKCRHQRLPTDGGKYADVTWLLSLAAQGLITWCHQPLMDYHLHGGNDGVKESLRDRLKFLATLKRHPDWPGRAGMEDYRYFLYRKWLEQTTVSESRFRRQAFMRRYLRYLKIRRFLRLADWQQWQEKKRLKRYRKQTGRQQ